MTSIYTHWYAIIAKSKKKTMHSCSASSGKPDSDSLECIVFSCFLVYHGWNRSGEQKDSLFWHLMYLYISLIHCCRYLCGNRCICTGLIFAVADAFVATVVSAIPWYSLLRMLFFRPMYLHLSLFMTCRCFSACLSCTIASTSCLFWDLRILPSQILHLHPTFSMPCGCFSLKLCIHNLLFL